MSQLSVDCVLPAVEKRLAELNLYAERLRKKLKRAPAGRLRLGKSNGVVQYFWVKSNKKSEGEYISKEKLAQVRSLAQKRYDEQMLKEILDEIKVLELVRKRYHPSTLEKIYSSMGHDRMSLVEPAVLQEDAFAERWLSVPYEGKAFLEDSAEQVTSSGIRVRSKSEAIIAETLNRLGVPFRYECPLNMGAESCWYPDFTCLNMRTREEFLWEHFGLMDKPDYVQGFVSKVVKLSSKGFDVGRNLIISVENLNHPMTPAYAERLIKRFLL